MARVSVLRSIKRPSRKPPHRRPFVAAGVPALLLALSVWSPRTLNRSRTPLDLPTALTALASSQGSSKCRKLALPGQPPKVSRTLTGASASWGSRHHLHREGPSSALAALTWQGRPRSKHWLGGSSASEQSPCQSWQIVARSGQ